MFENDKIKPYLSQSIHTTLAEMHSEVIALHATV